MKDFDLRLLLIEELQKRQKKNPQYSLKSFADFLEVSKSSLSETLTGRRPAGAKLVKNCYKKLDVLSQGTLKTFPHPLNYTEGTADQLALYTNLNMIMLMTLIKTDGFKNNPDWISRKLKISVREVESLIQQLIEQKIVTLQKNGKLVIKKINFHFSPLQINREVVIKTQNKILSQHAEVISRENFPNRCFADGTIPVDLADLPQARQMIAEFRNHLVSFFERKANLKKTRVYNLCISLAPFDFE